MSFQPVKTNQLTNDVESLSCHKWLAGWTALQRSKLLTVYALRFIKVFVSEVRLHLNAQKIFDGKSSVVLLLS